MREDYSTASPERGFYDLKTTEELDSLYEDITPTQPLEDDGTNDKETPSAA
ncbi:MAG: hypothetical protein WCL18_04870 [bacterium]